MIWDEDYKPPERQGRSENRPEETPPGERQIVIRFPRWIRLRILVLFVLVGLVCIAIIHSDTIKGVVLLRVASARAEPSGPYSVLVKKAGSSLSDQSLDVCLKLIERRPEDAGSHVLLGNAYAEVGRSDDAISAYRTALSLDPNCFDAHLGIGKAHFERGRYPEAADAYSRALKIRPGSADAYLSLGLALSNSGKFEEAMQAFKRAKELDPKIVHTQVMTGNCFLQAGMYAQAIECYEDAVRADQGHAQAYFNLGRAYLRLGDTALALEQQKILQELNPRLAQQLLSMIRQ